MLQLSLRPLVGQEGIKFGQLIVRKIINIVATRCQILRLICTEIEFGAGDELTAVPLTQPS